tara:strand:+ start:649 stop:1533 length:885 start_codon:yes stop_codon:yes gene_type:complete
MQIEVFLLLATVNILWGSSGVLIKLGLTEVDPTKGAFISTVAAAGGALVLSILTGEIMRSLGLFEIVSFMVAGFISGFAGKYAAYFGTKTIGASRGYSLTSTEIIFGVIISVLVLNEQINLVLVTSILILFTGIFFISMSAPNGKTITKSSVFYKGILVSILGGLFWGSGWSFAKLGIIGSGSPILGTLISQTTALVAFIPIILRRKKSMNRIRRTKYIYLSAAGLSSYIALLASWILLGTFSIGNVLSLTRLYPLITLVLSFFILQKVEKVNYKAVLGVILLVAGTYLSATIV